VQKPLNHRDKPGGGQEFACLSLGAPHSAQHHRGKEIFEKERGSSTDRETDIAQSSEAESAKRTQAVPSPPQGEKVAVRPDEGSFTHPNSEESGYKRTRGKTTVKN
jgi:hypothetical protein